MSPIFRFYRQPTLTAEQLQARQMQHAVRQFELLSQTLGGSQRSSSDSNLVYSTTLPSGGDASSHQLPRQSSSEPSFPVGSYNALPHDFMAGPAEITPQPVAMAVGEGIDAAQNFKFPTSKPIEMKKVRTIKEAVILQPAPIAVKRQTIKLTPKPIKKRIRNRFGNDTQHLGFEKQFVVNEQTGRANQLFSCLHCHIRTPKLCNIVEHQKTHRRQRTYKCCNCEHAFDHVDERDMHMASGVCLMEGQAMPSPEHSNEEYDQ